MNERIQELAEQAGFSIIREKFYIDDHIEKFAELIVQECAEIALEQKKWVENMTVFNPMDESWNEARIQQSQRIIDKIKEHFGVEE